MLKTQIADLQSEIAPYQISPDIGGVASHCLKTYFDSEHGEQFLERFAKLALHPKSNNFAPKPAEAAAAGDLPLTGSSFVITGTLSQGRGEFKSLIEEKGGKVTGSISKNTDYLLIGEGGGSKRDKAITLGVTVISESDFLEMLS